MQRHEKATDRASQSIFASLAGLVYSYRGLVVAVWGVMLLISLIMAPHLDGVLKGIGAAYEAGEAGHTERLLQQELKVTTDPLIVVFESPPEQTLEPYRADIEQLLAQTRRLPSVSAVTSTAERSDYRSANGRVEYSVINLKVNGSEAFPVIDRIEQLLNTSGSQNLKTYLTGKPVVDRDAQGLGQADLSRAESIALPLTLIALLFVFGSVVAAVMPVAMAVTTVSVTLGLLCLLTLTLDLSVFALNITTMLGLGLGIDYSLLMVNRFREELRSESVEQAVIRTVDTAGRAIFFSGLTVCIGLVSLLFFPILLLRSLGIAASLVVLLSVVAALTLLPALLAIVGEKVNRWHVVRFASRRAGIWTFLAQKVIRHSVAAVVIVLAVIAVLASPFLDVRFGLGDANALPLDAPSRQGAQALQRAFGPGEVAPILLAVSTNNPAASILSIDHITTLYNLVRQLKADARVASVTSLVSNPNLSLNAYQQLYSAPGLTWELGQAVKQLSNHSTTLVVVKSRTDSNDPASYALVQELRTLSLNGLHVQVGGQTAVGLDTLQVVQGRFPLVLSVITVVTFVVLCILLNSVILPLKAIVINLLSLGASFGALVFIFQQGNFKTWLNFTPVGYIDILLPVVMFCVLFGLSMDYEVFLLSRIKEAYNRSGDNSKSVVEGLECSGKIITSAALLMVIVTGSFALTSIIFVKALGLGIALAALIDATLIRVILVPASMHLLGKWNWWSPKFLRLKRIKLER